MTTSRKHFTRRRAGGARPVPGRRPAPRGGWAAVAAKLSAEGAVFAVVAGAITLAVLSQDPGARAATPRPPGHPTCYPPEAHEYDPAIPYSGQGVRRPPVLQETTIGPFATRRFEATRTPGRRRG